MVSLKSNKRLLLVLLLSSVVALAPARASHIAGGEMTYVFRGDSLGYHRYWVTLVLYQDCMNGLPEPIFEDNPAFFAVYSGFPYVLFRADSATYSSSVAVPALISTRCGITSSSIRGCTLKKTFILNYAFPSNATGYTVVYQRCCMNSSIINVQAPSDRGITLSCSIPPAPTTNSSAVFTSSSVGHASLNQNFVIDCSATDPDGDSLSYELCAARFGATNSDIKPWPPAPPPYDDAVYVSPFSFDAPIKCLAPVQLDPVTGMLRGQPTQAGVYLVAIKCNEWRSGAMINSVIRETELTVGTFADQGYHPDAGGDVTLIVGDKHQFNAVAANIYSWSPATYLSDQNIPDPIGTFPDPGVFTYSLHGITDSGCSGDDVIHVTVLDASSFTVPNAFSPNGYRTNNALHPYPIGNSTLTDFRVFNRLGNLVFQAGDLQSAYWDGRYKGKAQDMDVFVWQLKFTDNRGNAKLMKGNVTLVR